jgi:hypothetical protein
MSSGGKKPIMDTDQRCKLIPALDWALRGEVDEKTMVARVQELLAAVGPSLKDEGLRAVLMESVVNTIGRGIKNEDKCTNMVLTTVTDFGGRVKDETRCVDMLNKTIGTLGSRIKSPEKMTQLVLKLLDTAVTQVKSSRDIAGGFDCARSIIRNAIGDHRIPVAPLSEPPKPVSQPKPVDQPKPQADRSPHREPAASADDAAVSTPKKRRLVTERVEEPSPRIAQQALSAAVNQQPHKRFGGDCDDGPAKRQHAGMNDDVAEDHFDDFKSDNDEAEAEAEVEDPMGGFFRG